MRGTFYVVHWKTKLKEGNFTFTQYAFIRCHKDWMETVEGIKESLVAAGTVDRSDELIICNLMTPYS